MSRLPDISPEFKLILRCRAADFMFSRVFPEIMPFLLFGYIGRMGYNQLGKYMKFKEVING